MADEIITVEKIETLRIHAHEKLSSCGSDLKLLELRRAMLWAQFGDTLLDALTEALRVPSTNQSRLTTSDIAAIQARVDAATKARPMKVDYQVHKDDIYFPMNDGTHFGSVLKRGDHGTIKDLEFAAAAYEDIPALIADLATAERERDQVTHALRRHLQRDAFDLHMANCVLCNDDERDALCEVGDRLFTEMTGLEAAVASPERTEATAATQGDINGS